MQSNQSSRISMVVLAIFMSPLFFMALPIAVAQTEKVLYSFKGGNDGTNPSTGLIADASGNFFGTTTDGGSGGCGIVFELKPSHGGGWTETVIYSFRCGADGAAPAAGLIFDQAGNLYGTTLTGGKHHDGTVFRLTRSGGAWTESVLHAFTDKDGAYPAASLIFGHAGNLYGTTLFGGLSHGGTVFQLALSGGVWSETVLHNFTGHGDGIDPAAALIKDQEGALYGTTMGDNIFKLSPPAPGHTKWTFKSLYTFDGGANGGPLSAGTLLAAKNGVLYGTQKFGGSAANAGAVFQLTPPSGHGAWTETTIYRFAGGSDGLYPLAGVIADGAGNLYGTTAGDGQTSYGTVYRLTPPKEGGDWSETTLYAFTGGNDGSGPSAGLIFGKQGVLYSTTAGGGSSGNGTVFEIVP